jgi:hypothetical protein
MKGFLNALRLFMLFGLSASLFSFSVQQTYAKSTTIEVAPQSGSFRDPFTVSLVIDGHGETFNAAKATVTVSPTLAITDLVPGNCNFSYLLSPNTNNPSFEGAILGGSAQKCTVYTLTLQGVTKGSGTVAVTKARVLRFGDAVDIFSSVQNGSYTLTGTAKSGNQQTAKTTIPTPRGNLYTAAITVVSDANKPVEGATVNVQLVSGKPELKTTTDSQGSAVFPDLKPGRYIVIAEKQKQQTPPSILVVSGTNHIIPFSLKLLGLQATQGSGAQMNPLLIAGFVVLGVLLGAGVALSIPKLKGRRRNQK